MSVVFFKAPLSAPSVSSKTVFTAQEQRDGMTGERARTLAEALRIKAAVETTVSLLDVMDPERDCDSLHVPYLPDRRTLKAMGENRTLALQGNTYTFGTQVREGRAVSIYRVSNASEDKQVQVAEDGTLTYIEERKVIGRVPLARTAGAYR